MLAAAVKFHWQGFQLRSFKCDVLHEVCHESSVLHSYRWPAASFTKEESNWGLEILRYGCLGQAWPFWGCSGTVCSWPARHCWWSSAQDVELLPSSLEEECLVTSVVALMDVLWLFWFSAGDAQGSCSELVCGKALVVTDSCWVLLHLPLEEENGWNRLSGPGPYLWAYLSRDYVVIRE